MPVTTLPVAGHIQLGFSSSSIPAPKPFASGFGSTFVSARATTGGGSASGGVGGGGVGGGSADAIRCTSRNACSDQGSFSAFGCVL